MLFFYKKLFNAVVFFLETLTHIPEKRTKKRELTKIKTEKNYEYKIQKYKKITNTDNINNNNIIIIL